MMSAKRILLLILLSIFLNEGCSLNRIEDLRFVNEYKQYTAKKQTERYDYINVLASKLKHEKKELFRELFNSDAKEDYRIFLSTILFRLNCWNEIPEMIDYLQNGNCSDRLKFYILLIIEYNVGVYFPGYDFICPLNVEGFRTNKKEIIEALNDWYVKNRSYENREEYIIDIFNKLPTVEDKVCVLSFIRSWDEIDKYTNFLEKLTHDKNEIISSSAKDILSDWKKTKNISK
jgi:hypothetical protein